MVNGTSQRLEALSESDMPKGLMEQRFYDIHDEMMEDILHSLDEDDLMQLEAHCPTQVKFETWARKSLQKRFSIPDPMEYEFSPQDVPA
jgi:cytochrome c553